MTGSAEPVDKCTPDNHQKQDMKNMNSSRYVSFAPVVIIEN